MHCLPGVKALVSLAFLVAVLGSRPLRAEHTPHRAGHSECVSPLARPSNTLHFSGGYVGGGTALVGYERQRHEGTWGWDHRGIISRRPFLRWFPGRCQGGAGAYRTDGPHVPDPIGRLRI
jgi:hypothetical protein